jgi:hypothetical protein
MNTIIALIVFGALFASFALIRHRPDCGSNCGSCPKPCNLEEWKR